MAEYNVTTWTELREALKSANPGNTGERSHVINILAE